MRSRTPELFNYDKTQWSPEDGKKQLRDYVTCSMESRDPGKQKAGRAQKLTEDTCASAYQRSLSCLDKNGYDKSKCEDFFDLYRECKKREGETRLQRRQEKLAAGK